MFCVSVATKTQTQCNELLQGLDSCNEMAELRLDLMSELGKVNKIQNKNKSIKKQIKSKTNKQKNLKPLTKLKQKQIKQHTKVNINKIYSKTSKQNNI